MELLWWNTDEMYRKKHLNDGKNMKSTDIGSLSHYFVIVNVKVTCDSSYVIINLSKMIVYFFESSELDVEQHKIQIG